MELLEFPDELLVHITSHLDFRTLLIISPSCKKLHALSAEFLYQDVNLEYNNGAASIPFNNGNLGKFIRCITDCPRFALYVKTLRISRRKEADLMWSIPIEPDSPESQSLSLARLSSRDWITRMFSGSSEGRVLEAEPLEYYIAQLAYFCSRLRTLDIDENLLYYSSSRNGSRIQISDIVSSAIINGRLPVLESLHFGVNSRYTAGFCSIPRIRQEATLIPIFPFTAKSIKTLQTSYRDPFSSKHSKYWLHVANLQNLETLLLPQCKMGIESLGTLLATTKTLKRLEFTNFWQALGNDLDTQGRLLHCRQLRYALNCIGMCRIDKQLEDPPIADWEDPNEFPDREMPLEHLKLRILFTRSQGAAMHPGTSIFGQDWGFIGNLGSMKHYACLQTLEISPNLLFGVRFDVDHIPRLPSFLPDSLQSICFTDIPAVLPINATPSWDGEAICFLMMEYECGPQLPRLRKVGVKVYLCGFHYQFLARKAGLVAECLESICEKLGLDSEFEIEDDRSILTLGLLPPLQVYMREMGKGYDAGVENGSIDTESDVSTPSNNPGD